MILSSLKKWFSTKGRKGAGRAPARSRLGVEVLEDRVTPSNYGGGYNNGPTTYVVDNNLADKAQYTTIHAALAAVTANGVGQNGSIILVKPGIYAEQVVIGPALSNLTITTDGDPDATIVPPAGGSTGDGALVEVIGAKHVTINDFNIDGKTDPNTQYGIRVDGGGSASITFNNISDIVGNNGAGIVIGEAVDSTVGCAIVFGNSVSNYTKAGIVVDNVHSTAAVYANTVVGQGMSATIVQYGIQVSNGASADVEFNDVSGNSLSTGGADSAGILVFQGSSCGTFIDLNSSHNNEFGIFVVSTNNVDVSGNYAFCNWNDGIQLLGASYTSVNSNWSISNGGDGISVYAGGGFGVAAYNVIANNVIAYNAGNGVTIGLAGDPGDDPTHTLVTGNVIFDNGGSGVSVSQATGTAISFNLIDNDDGTTAISINKTDSTGTVTHQNLIFS